MDKIITEKNAKENGKGVETAFNQYKTYNTIRRNMRQAYSLINMIIQTQKNEESLKKFLGGNEVLLEAGYYTAIVLYARWFESTKGKITLRKKKFYDDYNKKYSDCHDYILKLRNQCIAHNEKDILGGDRVYICKDQEDNISVKSDNLVTIAESTERLEDIKKCIEIVHNKIDGDMLPKAQKNLEEIAYNKKLYDNI